MQLAFPFLFAEPAYQISVSRSYFFQENISTLNYKTDIHIQNFFIHAGYTTNKVNKYCIGATYSNGYNSRSSCPPSPPVLPVNHRIKLACMSQHLIILHANTSLKEKCKYAYYKMKTRASSGSTGRKIQFGQEIFFSWSVDLFRSSQ